MKLTEIVAPNVLAQTAIDGMYWATSNAYYPEYEKFGKGSGGEYWVTLVNGKINSSTSIAVNMDEMSSSNFEISLKFGRIIGDFKIIGSNIKTLKNFPNEIDGHCNFGCKGLWSQGFASPLFCKNIKSFEGITPIIGKFLILNAPIKSLIGIDKHIKKCQAMCLNFKRIKKGGLGLLNIEGLEGLYQFNGGNADGPFAIIKKYFNKPDQIFECQNELIENGYEEYAQL